MSRPMWSGSVSFGLVNIPVRLHTAVRDKSLHFHQVDSRDRSRVRYKIVNSTTGDEVPRTQIGKCFEISRDECIMLDPRELKKYAPEASRNIEIKAFVGLEQIDPVYFIRPYYLTPEPHAAKAYRLLVDAMDSTGKVGIAKFVMRGTEYLAALRPKDGVLCLDTMHFADEIVEPKELGDVATGVDVTDPELKAAQQLIKALASDFEPERFPAEHRERLLEMIQNKAAGAPLAKAATPREQAPRVLKLMDALKASLDETKKKEAAPRRKRSA
jgi:DNA end-binding protein Ku